MHSLKNLQDAHVIVSAFRKEYTNEELNIEIETGQLQELFTKNLHRLKSFILKEQHNEIDIMIHNLSISYLKDFSELRYLFENMEKSYIQSLRNMKDRKKLFEVSYEQQRGALDSEEQKQLETLQDQIYAKGFTDEQMADVLKNQKDIIQRDKELKEILKSV